MPELSNGKVRIVVAEKGAELQSVVRTDLQLEYLWSAEPVWAKKSPVLFPIVGTLKNNTYTFEGQDYKLGRHGFARDRVFTVTAQTADQLVFTLESDAASRKVFPFAFRFQVIYTLQESGFAVKYVVENTDDKPIYFSVGAHPAFKVPVSTGTYEDYYLAFNKTESALLWPLSGDGLIEAAGKPYLEGDKLPLKKSLFYKDALVFKHLASDAITLKSDVSPHGLTLHYPGFPYMGIWAAKDADFVCIEPWCGHADPVNASGKLEDKEGINALGTNARFEREWSVTLF